MLIIIKLSSLTNNIIIHFIAQLREVRLAEVSKFCTRYGRYQTSGGEIIGSKQHSQSYDCSRMRQNYHVKVIIFIRLSANFIVTRTERTANASFQILCITTSLYLAGFGSRSACS